MKNAKHYIVDKKTDEVLHGPYESAEIAATAAKHYDWFNDDEHEIAHGTHEMHDEISSDADPIDSHPPENHDEESELDFDDEFSDMGNNLDTPRPKGNYHSEDDTEEFTPVDRDESLDADIPDDEEDDGYHMQHDPHGEDSQDFGSHGHFIMHPNCQLPIAGPFASEEEATAFKVIGLDPNVVIVIGMLSSDGNFYEH